ncbi:MAG: RNA polymerase factor sigma-54 [Saprospiraceae bacterium]|nr:RNA polymerase factor sigma-54 [Saprospiraceae bacterium]
MFKNTQQQTFKQTLKLSPQQIQTLNLMQLPLFELEQKIKDEIDDNPALEYTDFGDAESGESPQSAENDYEADTDAKEDRDEFSDAQDLYDDIPYDGFSNTQETKYEKPVVETPTFRESLKEQLHLRQLDRELQVYAEYLIDAIDDDGYLHRTLDNIIDDISFSLSIYIDEKILEKALAVVQQLEPVGIGSRNLQEYLMIQLREKARTGVDVSVACAIVDDFMSELGNHNYERIQNTLNIDSETLKEALQIISSLNPKPVNGITSPNDPSLVITPDFIVTNNGGQLDITVVGLNSYKIKLNPTMLETLDALEKSPEKNTSNRDAVQYLKSKIGSAQWLISALEQREYSLTRTIETIVMLQQAFFLTGDVKKLRPMILKDIAERVGLDNSTISRVTSTRYVQTDFGIFSLKELFTEGVITNDGQIVSNRAIQETLAEIIKTENKTEPFNDQQLADMLAEKGYSVARRTVAKYRENLGIPTAQMRREMKS